MASTDKVKVAVRVRPFNRREVELGTKCVVEMDDTQTILCNPMLGMKECSGASSNSCTDVVANPAVKNNSHKTFAFDHCFWSISDDDPKYASQEMVFNCLGRDILKRAFEGYNACIFAYGQTGSGKSYSMMGGIDQRGIIPRLCDTLFELIVSNSDPGLSFKVEVSYMEIYNEKVRDLLDPKGKHNLKVREHTILGPYVDGLSTLAVSSFEDIDNLMCEGNKSRTVAATNMNSESSRSHAVFNIILTQTLTDLQTDVSGEKVSKISLVDLAGSERAQKTGAVGERLKEGGNINKSLTTLGLVISTLADQASGKSKIKFVPYRDSVLTWLLKDNLGGNSKTVMIATLSPSADNYEETLSTLRYADRAKRIVNHAVVNEDPNARIIRELREEVDMLRKMLTEAQQIIKPDDLRERLEESEKLMKEMGKTWEEKLNETERIHQERHAALEKMGISVQTSGIKVEQGKHYLVNLNADPSLNELLVYYLKETTLIGRPDAETPQDIQLLGLGIMSQHCIINIEGLDVYVQPLEGARTCVNGKSIASKTKVKHGDRIVWGNNHFFRINCPKTNSPSSEMPENIDFDFAQQELMLQQMIDDPIQEAISNIEKQHEEDKQEALEKQRQMYERQMQKLRNQLMSPSTPMIPYPFDSFAKLTPTGSGPSFHPKYQIWARDREKLFRQSLAKLKEEVVKANTLVREANFLAQEMAKDVDFSVTLQIPAANLSPNRRRGAFVIEPAILVKYKGRASQVWSMEIFENKVIELRDIFEDRKEKHLPLKDEGPSSKGESFFVLQENHHLIGVANIFLEVLFYDAKLEYHVPIISQQGEVAGRLHVQLCRLPARLPERLPGDIGSENGFDFYGGRSVEMEEESKFAVGSTVNCQVVIKEAKGLPPALSNSVFCQYNFWGHPEPIDVKPINPPDPVPRIRLENMSFSFNHTQEFTVHVTEEYMEHCAEGALSIEVWGNRSSELASLPGWELDQVHAKSRSILDRWNELTRKIEMWVEIHELNEQGEYVAVEVVQKQEIPTGGAYQLRQGHSRRIYVCIKPVQNSGTLPIICESISHLSIGCVTARQSKLQKGLDSYQEEDLNLLREKWSEALEKRREYLDEQLQKIMHKEASEKTEADIERERSLIDQWVCLTEERNAVLVPAVGSGIPGAPADWNHPFGMEQHIPVIFLDLNAEDMSTPNVKEGLQAAGSNSILPKEHGSKFYSLPFVKMFDKDVSVLASWDSSVHDSVHLNRVTPNNERIYMILKAVIKLSHPASMELVLRKRICINVYKHQSITDKLKRKIGKALSSVTSSDEYFQDMLFATGVTYEIVSNIPKASEDLEDRESLAQIAASQNDQGTGDGESYIEKYIKGVSAVESILALDRLRQDVAVKEILAMKGRPLRKATSVPNIHNFLASPSGVLDQMHSDSNQDITSHRDNDYVISSLPKHLSDNFLRSGITSLDIQKDFGKKDNASQSTRPNFLNLRTNICSPSGTKAGMSPAQSKHLKPLTTLVEERTKPVLNLDQTIDSDGEDDEFDQEVATVNGYKDGKTSSQTADSTAADATNDNHEFDTFQKKPSENQTDRNRDDSAPILTNSVNTESPMENLSNVKMFTPSLASSGYGSQAISTQTLSSEDSASVQSINIEESNEFDHAKALTSLFKKSSLAEHSLDDHSSHETCSDRGLESLIDTAVPNNLGSLMKPTTPYLEHNAVVGANENDPEKTEDIIAESVDCKSTGQLNDEFASTKESSDTLVTVEKEQSSDTIEISEASVNRSADDTPVNGNNDSDDSHKHNGDNWQKSNTLEITAGKDNSSAPAAVVVVDLPKPLATRMKPKLRGISDAGSGKMAPMKATYRPASMHLEVVERDKGSSQEELNNSDNEDSVSICSFGSRADLNRLGESPLPSWIQLNEPVIVLFSQAGESSKTGIVRFVGRTEFAAGNWVGVELDTPDGKNDGYVKGVRYFRCRTQHGVFVRHDKLIQDKKRKTAKMAKVPTNLRRSTGNLSSAVAHKDTSTISATSVSPMAAGSSLMKPTAASSAKHK